MKHVIVKSRPDWATLNEQWTRSGLRQKEFCERHGVSYNVFLKHRRRFIQDGTSASSTASFADFIPVEFKQTPPRAAAPEIVVELPMGVTIRFRGVQGS